MPIRIDHIRLPVSDIDVSRAFYAAALAPLGYRIVYDQDGSLGLVVERVHLLGARRRERHVRAPKGRRARGERERLTLVVERARTEPGRWS